MPVASRCGVRLFVLLPLFLRHERGCSLVPEETHERPWTPCGSFVMYQEEQVWNGSICLHQKR
jgi:hypothetical protein